MRRLPPTAALLALAAALAAPAAAAPLTLVYDSFLETKTVGARLLPADPILIDGRVADATATILANTLLFTPGSASVSLAASWLTAPAGLRTLGVNIDLLDPDGLVLASDSFAGLAGAQARSTLSYTGLIPGAQYRLAITGLADQAARYQLDLRDGAQLPDFPTVPATTPIPLALTFDTHAGSKAQGPAIAPGGQLAIDGRMADDRLASVVNEFTFQLTGGTLSAGLAWLAGAGPQRLTGVNLDLFDSFGDVVATDSFRGLVDGQAFSQFAATGLNPGTYRLVLTGTAPEGARYHIDLSTDPRPPGFTPIADDAVPVPEAASAALLLAGLAALGGVARRRPLSPPRPAPAPAAARPAG